MNNVLVMTVGEIVDCENTFLLCYIRGPEGLIVELAERLDGARGRSWVRRARRQARERQL